MHRLIIALALMLPAAAQMRQTAIEMIPPAANTAPYIDFKDLRPSTYRSRLLGASGLAGNVDYTLPGQHASVAGYCLQDTNAAGSWGWGPCAAERFVDSYDWSKTVGATTIGGTVTLTFAGTSCPAAATDTNYRARVYETASPTVYETPATTGGTCTRGGSGTLTFTTGTAFTNATFTSASAGLQEAFFSVADSVAVHLRAAVRNYYVYSDALTEDRYVTLNCNGPGATFIPAADGVKIINAASPGGVRVHHCAFNNVLSKAGTIAIYTYNPDGDSFGSSIIDNNISGFEKCVHLESVYGLTNYSYNRHINCTDTALHLENPNTGDGGIGLVGPGNIFSDSVNAPYGIQWNGPGNLKVIGNSFNGFVKQVYGRMMMGRAYVNGTSVTWDSGHKFRASYFTPTAGNFVCGSTVASAITGYTDSDHMTIASGPAMAVTCDYYINNTGQLLIQGNTFDSWTWTTNDVELAGDVLYLNWQIQGNFSSNPNASTFDAAYKVSGANWYFGSIEGNNAQTSYAIGTGIKLDGGYYIRVSDNQLTNLPTGIAVGAASYVTEDGNPCSGHTDCITSTSSTATIRQVTPVTYTQLAALSAANSSTLYCSNCKRTSASSATCATGGSGARATRINGAWKCDDGSAVNAFVQGGNSFGATAELGTSDAYGLQLNVNGVGRWLIPTTGHLYAGSNNTYDIGAGLSANSPRTVYAATSVVSAAGDFAPSGGSSANYVKARKFNIVDQSGGAGFWDMMSTATGGSSSLSIRDNSGSRWLVPWRVSSSTPVNYTYLYSDLLPAKRDTGGGDAVTDSNFPSLGSTSFRWDKVWAVDASLTGSTALQSVTVGGNVTTGGNISPGVSGTGNIGGSSALYGKGWFAALRLDTGASTTGYCWTATNTSGDGSWQSCSGAVTFSDSVFRIQDNGDTTKQFALEVSAITTGTTRTMTVPNASFTVAGTNVSGQDFITPQRITYNSAGAYGSELTLTNTSVAGAYAPSCLTLAATDTVGSTQYGVARLCAGFESASFTDELVKIQTATGSGTYTDALTIKNTGVTVVGTFNAQASTLASLTMAGNQTPGIDGLGSVGTTGTRYGTMAAYSANFGGGSGTITFLPGSAPTVGYCWLATTTAGAGDWAACPGGQWTTSGSDIYRATGSVWIGSSSNNISAKLQVENSASVNLLQLKYTGSVSSISGGGIIAHQGSLPTAADNRLAFFIGGAEVGGTQYNRAAITVYSSQTWSAGTAEGAYIDFATTASNSTARTSRMRISDAGHLICTTDGSCDMGQTGANRFRNAFLSGGLTAGGASSIAANLTVSGGSSLIMDRATRGTNQQFYWGVAGNVATTGAWSVGLVPAAGASTFVIAHNGTAIFTGAEGGVIDLAAGLTTGGSVTVTGSATANRFNATNTNPYQVGGTTIVDSSRNATFQGLTTTSTVSMTGATITAGSTFSSDLIPTTNSVYVLGSPSFLWGNIHGDIVTVYTSLLPDASLGANLGGGTRRWTKTWTGDIDISGTLTPPSGTALNGTTSCAAGQAVKSITFSAGIATAITCATP